MASDYRRIVRVGDILRVRKKLSRGAIDYIITSVNPTGIVNVIAKVPIIDGTGALSRLHWIETIITTTRGH